MSSQPAATCKIRNGGIKGIFKIQFRKRAPLLKILKKEQFQTLEAIVCLSVAVINQVSTTAGTSSPIVKQSNSNLTSLSSKNIYPLKTSAFMIKYHFRIMASVRITAMGFHCFFN